MAAAAGAGEGFHGLHPRKDRSKNSVILARGARGWTESARPHITLAAMLPSNPAWGFRADAQGTGGIRRPRSPARSFRFGEQSIKPRIAVNVGKGERCGFRG